MATAKLDFNHPFFLRSLKRWGIAKCEQNLGLQNTRKEIEKNHLSCHHVCQPMPGHPHCWNKIWKYDWSPPEQNSATRKKWRLLVIVKDAKSEPYELVAASVYMKGDMDSFPKKELLKIFLAITSPIETSGDVDDLSYPSSS